MAKVITLERHNTNYSHKYNDNTDYTDYTDYNNDYTQTLAIAPHQYL